MTPVVSQYKNIPLVCVVEISRAPGFLISDGISLGSCFSLDDARLVGINAKPS